MPNTDPNKDPREEVISRRMVVGGVAATVAMGALMAGPEYVDAFQEPDKTSYEEIKQDLLGDKTDSAPALEVPVQPTPGSLPEVAVQGMPENTVVVPGNTPEA